MSHSREPVGQTCPDIDKIIKEICDARDCCYYKDDETVDELQGRLADIRYDLDGIPDTLEKLRDSNYALRMWGEEEAEEVDKLQDKEGNCPFCQNGGFDLIGLKHHLKTYCEVYNKIEELR